MLNLTKKHWFTVAMSAVLLFGGIGATMQALGDDDEDEAHERREHSSERGERGEREGGGEGGEMGEGLNMNVTNTTWKAECSACHIAYPPGLLPASSWRAMMNSLDKHFDTDASLDAKAVAEILPFLEQNAAPESRQEGTADKPVLRITETRWFKREHDEVSAITWKKVKSPSNCAACHTQADKGNFDEDSITLPK